MGADDGTEVVDLRVDVADVDVDALSSIHHTANIESPLPAQLRIASMHVN